MKKLFLLLIAVSGLLFSCSKSGIEPHLSDDHLVGNWTGLKAVVSHWVDEQPQCPINTDVDLRLFANGQGTYNGYSISWTRISNEAADLEEISFVLDGNSTFSVAIEVDETHQQQWRGRERVTGFQTPREIIWTLRKDGLIN